MTQSLNLVFCGTPNFAVPTLEKLVDAGFRVHLVVTQPDRPKGRGLELVPSPVKGSARKLNLPIAQPDRIKSNDEFRAQLAAVKPDAIIVVGYGRIIPPWMLDLPPLGNINLHASLLPKYRGAAPIQWAIANGETVTGVTTMRIDAGLDTGDILEQEKLATAQPRPQDNSQATLAPILKKEDGLVDFSRTAAEIFNRIRGFQPWPGAYTRFRGKILQIVRARPASVATPPAELQVLSDRLVVGCAPNTSLELLEIQLEGKKRTSAQDFIHGYRPHPGEKLGQIS
jgi:methionyl-tRNA formyltransferase